MKAHHPANPKALEGAPEVCPNCQSKREDRGTLHGRTRLGRNWVGHYAFFECGMLIVLKDGLPQVWNECGYGRGVVDVEFTARDLTPEEVAEREAERRRKQAIELQEFMNGGRFQYVRPFFTDDTTSST